MFGSRAERYALWALAIPSLLVLLAPVAIVVIVSFSGSEYLEFPPPTLSLRWHRAYWTDAGWRDATITSVEVAVGAAVIATIAGVAAAVALTRGGWRARTPMFATLLSPMIIPTIITAIGYYFVARWLGLAGTVVGIALGEAILALPIVIIVVLGTLNMFDRRLEQAALSLGASRWYAFRRITLPLIAPGVLSAALFAFLAAFDELLIPLFLGGTTIQTLTVRIWSGLQVQLDTTIAAVSVLFISITVVVLGIRAITMRAAE